MTNIDAKVAQMLSDFLGFLQASISTKACYFLGNFWRQIGLLFIPRSGHTDCIDKWTKIDQYLLVLNAA